jgi:glycosyltransferase involved in cell wall biosynthesis
MSTADGRLGLSLVVPVFNEEGNVGALHGELTRVATALGQPYEIVFVNDGSRDGTRTALDQLRATDPHLRIVDLDGNFGEAAALSAGFAHARGEVVVTLDGDGQNDPADIPRLLARLDPGIDVVSGRRRRRKEGFFLRVLPSWIANRLIVLATGVPVYDCGCGLKVYRRAVLAGAQLPRGMNRFLPAILGVAPSHVAEVWVDDRARGSGTSHYGFSRTLIVLRDLLALPLLVRRPEPTHVLGQTLDAAQGGLVVLGVVGVLGALGWPAGRVLALVIAAGAAFAATVGSAIAYNVRRYTQARMTGVFKVREVS